MLLLLCLLLPCWALCHPVPISSAHKEALENIKKLKGRHEVTPLNYTTLTLKEERSTIAYLDKFIEVLERESSLERKIAQNLRMIRAYVKMCPGLQKHVWEPEDDSDFLDNLEDLLRFLKHNGCLEETT